MAPPEAPPAPAVPDPWPAVPADPIMVSAAPAASSTIGLPPSVELPQPMDSVQREITQVAGPIELMTRW